ncbi:uncharacterized protein LOC131225515 [Magnolia sinica]|uniref:uncharacterized protein LOC131225515 n=1 Tax=Magnolia sinica TaxID=86752 RepID=UPI00265A433E|nr:uncharacterized protein LOC131225515 [Magnolia sinica]
MATQEKIRPSGRAVEPTSSPRISFSIDFAGDMDSRIPNMGEREKTCDPDFEFLASGPGMAGMLTADELFSEGQLLPYWHTESTEKLERVTLKEKEEVGQEMDGHASRVSWSVDDDPSPRPPKCTVLWKELLRLKKQHPVPARPSSPASMDGLCSKDDGKGEKSGPWKREKQVKRVKKGLERTRSASVRIRPVVHVPICNQGKNNALPLLFALKK